MLTSLDKGTSQTLAYSVDVVSSLLTSKTLFIDDDLNHTYLNFLSGAVRRQDREIGYFPMPPAGMPEFSPVTTPRLVVGKLITVNTVMQ